MVVLYCGRYLAAMFTIYSIGRAVSSNRIVFPSVFSGGGDWGIDCRGGSLREGRDFMVFGEVHRVGGAVMLALLFAEAVEGGLYFCRAGGVSDGQGRCSGWEIGGAGAFTGEVFAVDGDRVLLSGGVFSVGSDLASQPLERGAATLHPEVAGGDAGTGRGELVEGSPGGTKVVAPKPADVKPGDTDQTQDSGSVLKVIKPVLQEDFPVAEALPELGEVKRDDLARKAESRKKDDGKAPKRSAGEGQKISKGGLRLGKDSPGDKSGAGGQNIIDESELW
jgi:hypothetical protein